MIRKTVGSGVQAVAVTDSITSSMEGESQAVPADEPKPRCGNPD
ncbi:hypothetical protein RESH_04021 [Rhodopirellula europaea SH398]|uniref:Uncharacterized protein n=1 Tax=Rhodopirellula europaea SH398 TaxID=1263868 RepID=M5S1C4_9BACT|nr:hypothetical protein RESH_04021 [Rhodopirellula europaea SH398]